MVLAVAVAVGKDHIGIVRHQPAVPERDADIAHATGHPVVDPLRLLSALGDAGGDLLGERLDLGRDLYLLRGEREVGMRELVVAGEARNEISRQAIIRRERRGILHEGIRSRIAPAVERLVAHRLLLELEPMRLRPQRHRLRRAHGDLHLLVGESALKVAIGDELAREGRMLLAPARGPDDGVAAGEIRKDDHLLPVVVEHSQLRRAGLQLRKNGGDVDRQLLAVRLERIGLDDLEILH